MVELSKYLTYFLQSFLLYREVLPLPIIDLDIRSTTLKWNDSSRLSSTWVKILFELGERLLIKTLKWNDKWPLTKVSSTWIRILFKLGDSGERIALWSWTTPSRQKSRTSKGQIEREKCLNSSLNHWPGNGFKNENK